MFQTAEQTVREFAEKLPTPNVLRALHYCETGELTWQQVAVLFQKSLSAALEEVK